MFIIPSEIKTKFRPDYGVGIEWIGADGIKRKSVCRQPRKIYLKISSYVGTCAIGAMHWYARVEVGSLGWKEEGEEGIYSGFGGGNIPKEIESIEIDVSRRLTKVERDMNDEVIGKIGDTTWRFNSEQDAGMAGLRAVQAAFEGDWIVCFEACNGGDYEFPLSELKVTKEFLDFCNKECEKCFD